MNEKKFAKHHILDSSVGVPAVSGFKYNLTKEEMRTVMEELVAKDLVAPVDDWSFLNAYN